MENRGFEQMKSTKKNVYFVAFALWLSAVHAYHVYKAQIKVLTNSVNKTPALVTMESKLQAVYQQELGLCFNIQHTCLSLYRCRPTQVS